MDRVTGIGVPYSQLRYRGQYDPLQTYLINNIVLYNNRFWLYVLENPQAGVTPSEANPTFWQDLGGDTTCGYGTLSNRPTASNDNIGRLYFDSTNLELFVSTGSTWVSCSNANVATTTKPGLIKVNSNNANPVVYRKEELDATVTTVALNSTTGVVSSTLNVGGLTTLGGGLTVTGSTTLNNAVTVVGTLGGAAATFSGALGANSLTVSGSAGIGNLTVTGTINVSNTSTFTGAASFGNTLSTVGTASIGSNLNVTSAAVIGGSLGVTGNSTFTTISTTGLATLNSSSVTNNAASATLSTTGLATLNSAAVTNNATVGGTLGVTANASFSTLSTSGLATLNSVAVSGSATVPTQATSDNSTKVATTAFVAAYYAAQLPQLSMESIRDTVGGRISTSTTSPDGDVSGDGSTTYSASVYYTPLSNAGGGSSTNQIGLYSSSAWSLRTFSSITLTGSLAAYSSPAAGVEVYDVFLSWNGSAVVSSLVAWNTSAAARVTSLSTQDGVYVLSTDVTKRYVGTMCRNASGFSDCSTARWIYNHCNQIRKPLASPTISAVNVGVALVTLGSVSAIIPFSTIPVDLNLQALTAYCDNAGSGQNYYVTSNLTYALNAAASSTYAQVVQQVSEGASHYFAIPSTGIPGLILGSIGRYTYAVKAVASTTNAGSRVGTGTPAITASIKC